MICKYATFYYLYIIKDKQIMETLEIIKKHTENVNCSRSFYVKLESKLVRISNHLPKTDNFSLFNEEIEKVLLVFVSNEYNTIDERQASNYCESVRNIEIEYIIINEEMPFEGYNTMIIENFLND